MVNEQVPTQRQPKSRLPCRETQGVRIEERQATLGRQWANSIQHRTLEEQAEAAQPIHFHPLAAVLFAPAVGELIHGRQVERQPR